MVEVKNINGTSKDRYSNPKEGSSWADYWKSVLIPFYYRFVPAMNV